MKSIVEAIASACEVEPGKVVVANGRIEGSLTIRLLRTDLAEVLSANGSSYTSEHGHRVDWLDWLLTRGDSLIVLNFHFYPGNIAGSRTGIGIMGRGGVWRVPPEYSGIPGNNWLTRALANLASPLEDVVRDAIAKVM